MGPGPGLGQGSNSFGHPDTQAFKTGRSWQLKSSEQGAFINGPIHSQQSPLSETAQRWALSPRATGKNSPKTWSQIRVQRYRSQNWDMVWKPHEIFEIGDVPPKSRQHASQSHSQIKGLITGCSFTYSDLFLQRMWEFTFKGVCTMQLLTQKLKVKPGFQWAQLLPWSNMLN